MSECKWKWRDEKETVLECTVHENEREFVKANEKEEVLRTLREAGQLIEEATPTLAPPPVTTAHYPAEAKALVPTVAQAQDLVEYETITGQQISLNVEGFQTLLCRQANKQQAMFSLAWCKHNRIDPYANEAHFSVIDNQIIIQVSKDAWFKRMEAHPDFDWHDSGIMVKATKDVLVAAAIMENDDYVMTEAMKKALQNPKATLPEQLTVKKRGQYIDEGETLLGGWCLIKKKSRPAPIPFQINLKGWEQVKRDGSSNVFWDRKAPFMIWKTALKNGARLAFPDLSGMLGHPEFDETGEGEGNLRLIPQDARLSPEEQRKALLGTLHAAGNDVPPPHGPFNHLDLHNLAAAIYSVDSLAQLNIDQLSILCGQVTVAQTDEETAQRLASDMEPRSRGSLKLPKRRTSDQMGV